MPDAKQAIVDVWTQTPSGSRDGSPGTRGYIEDLLAESLRYAPWLPEALGVHAAAGLEVLDVGCGPGVDLVRFAQSCARVTGVDLVPTHVEQSQAHLEAMGLAGEVALADAESLPFPDQSFDRVLAVNSLQFTSGLPLALREVRRVLRPGGDLRLVVYNRRSFYWWWNVILLAGIKRGELLRTRSPDELLVRSLPWASTSVRARAFTAPRLRAVLAEASLRPIQVDRHGWYLAAAAKPSGQPGRAPTRHCSS